MLRKVLQRRKSNCFSYIKTVCLDRIIVLRVMSTCMFSRMTATSQIIKCAQHEENIIHYFLLILIYN